MKNSKNDNILIIEITWIGLIRKIYYLVKENGYTLQGAKDKLKTDSKIVDANIEVIEKLERIKAFLTQLKKEL